MPHPVLYQLNTRVHLQERGARLGRPALLSDVSDAFLDALADGPWDWLWLLGVWQTGPRAREVSLRDAALRRELRAELPDVTDDDVTGSPFAVGRYRVREEWGGDEALAGLRERLARRGLRLMLDFVPNHVGLDHPWVDERPEYFVHGTEEDLAAEPKNYTRVPSMRGEDLILAHGRDPFFAGWPDTLQLNYRHAGLREAMREVLAGVAQRCDGARCDMAMLVQPDVFARTWGERAAPADCSEPVDTPFWPEAIARAREYHPDFTFVAEVYWDREWELQQEGFDFTYDKRLYDRLRDQTGHQVREHLLAEPDYQRRSVRFLENHDEPRAAAVFAPEVERAAAVITYFAPGMRFFHDGQLEGRRTHVSLHVGRRADEPVDAELRAFHERVLDGLKRPELHEGQWRLWPCRPAGEGDASWRHVVVMSWAQGERRLLIAVNYAPERGQCVATLELPGLAGRTFELVDLLDDETRYTREGDALRGEGLYLDLPAWGHHVFALHARDAG
jgi:hypothetical protein